MTRALSDEEGAVLDALLQGDWPGAEQLRRQTRAVQVSGKCGCGCATVDLTLDRRRAPQAPAENPAPKEGTAWNDDWTQVLGGILLFVREGWLSRMEIWWLDVPIEVFPPLNRIDFEMRN